MKKVLLFIWQLPQNLIGFFMLAFHKYICKHEIKEMQHHSGVRYFLLKHVNDCGISLGNYIFLDSDRSVKEKDVLHEHGHQLQSQFLGPFYLLIIGIPSACGNVIQRIFNKNNKWYYSQPWEKWADKLGGVHR